MAYNEVITYLLCFGIFVCGFLVGELRVRAIMAERLESKSREMFELGFSEAKQYYYLDKKEEDRLSSLSLVAENAGFNPITSDLLMAYGVTRVGQLPTKVREMYRVTEADMSMDIDTLLRRESETSDDI